MVLYRKMTTKQDIASIEDIRLLVNTFYDKVRQDALLKDIFEAIIQERWPAHLEKMYRFWQTVLLEEHTYQGSPFAPHASMPIGAEHFERWFQLFTATLDEHFQGEKAEEAKWRAENMAKMFHAKISYYQSNNKSPLPVIGR